MFSLGLNPKLAREQIATSRRFYSAMKYNHGAGRLKDGASDLGPPPDLFILVLDSLSRASFHRSFPSFVDRLRQKDEVDVFENVPVFKASQSFASRNQ